MAKFAARQMCIRDRSYLKHRPHDRARRTTKVYAKQQRGHAYDAALAALARGEQVYVVCPLVGKDAGERDAKAVHGRSVEEDADEALHPAVSIEAVSYTHLDVYKRQSQRRPLPPAVGRRNLKRARPCRPSCSGCTRWRAARGRSCP